MVGILVSSWDTLFSGAMLVSGRVSGSASDPHGRSPHGAWRTTLGRRSLGRHSGGASEVGGGKDVGREVMGKLMIPIAFFITCMNLA